MQGDIFQMEQMAAQVHATQLAPAPLPLEEKTEPGVAIYNEDDLSHLLYANHMHHEGHKHRVIVNHVYRDGFSTPLSTGTQTPESDSEGDTPVFSDCDSYFGGEGASPPSSSLHAFSHKKEPLRFEDGFDFPVFLGRQAEESVPHEMGPSVRTAPPPTSRAEPAPAEDEHVRDISGPLMSWWPTPTGIMEHEWVQDEAAAPKSSKVVITHQHVSGIEGSMMSWWPTPIDMMEYEWNERFYE
ncbi:hypothetical protein GGR52DRAFT_479211 [Hypoxylon sp. FL1284]|nr:hypothetical protein GGR52DRAFT_479211 [Hypoxylon sp. FL1284]